MGESGVEAIDQLVAGRIEVQVRGARLEIGMQLQREVFGEMVGVGADGEEVGGIFDGAKRVRGTSMAAASGKHSMAAPMAVSSWMDGGGGGVTAGPPFCG